MENTTQKTEDLFLYNLESCKRLASNLQFSLQAVNLIYPFNDEVIKNITEENKQLLDAFILRFSKLQDLLGNKMFRLILVLEVEDIGFMMDILNKMEKFKIIDDAGEWVAIRQARNDAIHDYDLRSDKIAEKLNEIVTFAPKLFQVLRRVEEYTKNKFK